MSGGGNGGTTTTVQQADPWEGQQGYLSDVFNEAQSIYDSSEYSYPETTVADLSDYTTQAIEAQAARALEGSEVTDAAQSLATSTLNGDYLNSNEYLDANFAAGSEAITQAYNDAINSNTAGFVSSGRYGSGLQEYANSQAQEELADSLGNLYTETYYQNYEDERDRQTEAMSQSTDLANQDYTDLDALSSAGAALDEYNQALVDAGVDEWNYETNYDSNLLANYMNLIQGNYGSSNTTASSSSGSSSTTSDILSSLSLLYGLS